MPQTHRSIAFSNKKKKEQLKVKKARKKLIASQEGNTYKTSSSLKSNYSATSPSPSYVNVFQQEVEEINKDSSRNCRYNLKFRKQDKTKNTSHHYEAIAVLPETELESDYTDFFPPGLDYPRRPPWKQSMSKAELEQLENKTFRLFCEDLDQRFGKEDFSLYELNLETWRQLWRVTEMSDILLIIADARFPVAQFPPYLYEHFVIREKRDIILILNKCDLLPSSLVLAWHDYFKEKFPKLTVLPFSSLEGKDRKKSNLKMATEGARRLIDACQMIVQDNVDLNPWRQKIEEEQGEISQDKCHIMCEHQSESFYPKVVKKYEAGILTIGTIGYPNVGKSSLINALMGKKVVSVSRTPGHTKHFQTIFITKNVKLCDCPGLVFPSVCPKQLQVVIGSYPIAQVRDTLASISFIASRINIPQILKLCSHLPDFHEDNFQWTPFYISEAWARKRGYFIRTKGGRPDINRAANELLRLTLSGFKSLVLTLTPPGYSDERYVNDPRQAEIRSIQGVHARPDITQIHLNDQYAESMENQRCESESETDDNPDSEDAFEGDGEPEIFQRLALEEERSSCSSEIEDIAEDADDEEYSKPSSNKFAVLDLINDQ